MQAQLKKKIPQLEWQIQSWALNMYTVFAVSNIQYLQPLVIDCSCIGSNTFFWPPQAPALMFVFQVYTCMPNYKHNQIHKKDASLVFWISVFKSFFITSITNATLTNQNIWNAYAIFYVFTFLPQLHLDFWCYCFLIFIISALV